MVLNIESWKHVIMNMAMFGRVYFSYLLNHKQLLKNTSRLTLTCSKSTIETLQKGVKYVQR